ncbi:ribulose-phosphate 3-epimerase [Lactobacillus rodentium]|uniref:Ribulose-phosphate 3-epimerase n=1 Tax=Lactobacillus rodentium TaxID=947835 RepID=A0A2Z6T7Y4_9LACO|nr:ribulose-phosphate 3-epimerase [Lactobacillus rodentium]MCR1894081.1 ribulose-phosphate 3-epimerase [Lactobacillus rodentium]GBG04378.1 ribulose-5-phosphate 3-epimerase [Lactobacillus rodentium]
MSKIAPSILNADNMNLGSDIQEAIDTGIKRFHIDIMDGHFVPNLSYGPELVKDFKEAFPNIEAEIHLMSNNLDVTIPAFVKAGADLVEFHYEATDQVEKWLNYLKDHNVKAGLVINPETPVEKIKPYLDLVDQILVMTVKPGFGGQSFRPDSDERISQVKELITASGKNIKIEVDGGIDDHTAEIAKNAGADIFVAGSFIFKKGPIAQQILKLENILV